MRRSISGRLQTLLSQSVASLCTLEESALVNEKGHSKRASEILQKSIKKFKLEDT